MLDDTHISSVIVFQNAFKLFFQHSWTFQHSFINSFLPFSVYYSPAMSPAVPALEADAYSFHKHSIERTYEFLDVPHHNCIYICVTLIYKCFVHAFQAFSPAAVMQPFP